MNHLSPLLNHLKKNVSRDRTRFEDDRFDLDLAYITDNIIEAVWRNHIDDVAEMLKSYHDGHYKIWNLSERTYDYTKFENQIVDYGFPDHHSPPLKTLFEIVWSMFEWLKSDKLHVSAVHCMGGKGRTGTVICAYLIFINRFQTPDESFAYFAAKRSAIEKGVTQPSQKRQIIQNQIFPKPKVLQINKIMLVSVPGLCKGKTGCNPVCRVYAQTFLPKTLVFSSSPKGQPAKFFSRADGAVVWKVDCLVQGDILIKGKHAGKHRSRRLFRFAFHTAFVNDTYVELKPEDLDDWRVLSEKEKERQKEKASQKGEPIVSPREGPIEEDKDFSLIIYFTEPQIPAADIHVAANKQEQAMGGQYEGVLTSMFEAKKTMKPYVPETVAFKPNPIHREDSGTFAASRLYQEPSARHSGEATESADQAKTMLREYYERQLPNTQLTARDRLGQLREQRQQIKDNNGLLRGSHISKGRPELDGSGSSDSPEGQRSPREKLSTSPRATSPRSASPQQAASPRATSPVPTPVPTRQPPVPPLALSSSPRSPRSPRDLDELGRGSVDPSSGQSLSPRKSPRKASEPVPVTPWVHTSARLREEMGSSRPSLMHSPSEMSTLRAAAAEARSRAATLQMAPVSKDLNPLVGTITLESGEEAEISIDCILGPRSTVRLQALSEFSQKLAAATPTAVTSSAPASPATPASPTSMASPSSSPVVASAFSLPLVSPSASATRTKVTAGSYRTASAYNSPVSNSTPPPMRPTPSSPSLSSSPSAPVRISVSGSGSIAMSPLREELPPPDFLPPPDAPPPPPPDGDYDEALPPRASPSPTPTHSPTPTPAAAHTPPQQRNTVKSVRASRRPMMYEASEVQTLSRDSRRSEA